jgi:hypothetical protein
MTPGRRTFVVLGDEPPQLAGQFRRRREDPSREQVSLHPQTTNSAWSRPET